MHYLFRRISFFVLVITLLSAPVSAQQYVAKVAAVVGSDVITTFDVEERLALAITSSGLQGQPGVVPKLLKQIIRLLIDERLQAQEAEKLGISVSDQEVVEAFHNLEKTNNLQFGQFEVFLRKQGVSPDALKDQLRAQILWNKIVIQKIRSQIRISDQEVDESIDYISAQGGATEVQLQEIILPVDTPQDEEEVIALSKQLYSELQEGADFGSVAKEFSRSYSASSGGEIGWTRLEQLPKKLVIHIRDVAPGNISQPVKIGDGYYIIKVLAKRLVKHPEKGGEEIALRQAFIPAATEEAFNLVLEQVKTAQSRLTQCDQFPEFAQSMQSQISPEVIGAQLKSLNKKIRDVVENLPDNRLSPAIKSEQGVHVVMVCSRKEMSGNILDRQAIKEEIYRQKLSLQSRQYLRNLQRSTYIEIRL